MNKRDRDLDKGIWAVGPGIMPKTWSSRLRLQLRALVVLSCLLMVSGAGAATIQADSLERDSVQAAIDAASSGDTVLLPEGTVTWTTSSTIPNNKKITLMGSGKESSIISTTESAPWAIFNMGSSGSRITRVGFRLANDNGVGITVRGRGWRVDHCRFENLIEQIIEGVSVRGEPSDNGSPVGLVDNCEFVNTRVLVVGDANLMAHAIWAEPLDLGADNATFVENCTFLYTQHCNAIDANYGGRYVFRHNAVTDGYVEAHSVQGTHRATRSWEIYGNAFSRVSRSMWTPFFLRGGSGVVFENTVSGTWTSPSIVVDNVRTARAAGDGGQADGTSLWDGNEDETGYPARDQIGRSTDQWLWTTENPYPPQELDPFYQWNNRHNGNAMNVFVHNNCGAHIKANRDYYNQVPRPGYVPYRFPHPLSLDNPSGRVLGLSSSVSEATIHLHWNAIQGASAYRVLGNWEEKASGLTSTTWSGVRPGDASTYMVYATDVSGRILAAEGVFFDPSVTDNNAPVFTPIGDHSIPAGQQLQFTVQATDADGDALQYSTSGGG